MPRLANCVRPATEADLTLSVKLEEADRFAIELANHVTAGQAVMDRIAKILAVARQREMAEDTPAPVNRAQEALRRLKSRRDGKGQGRVKSIRLLPLVVFAALALLVLKGIGLVTEGSYALTGVDFAMAQSRGRGNGRHGACRNGCRTCRQSGTGRHGRTDRG